MISKRLGPASIRTTYDVCGHLFEGRDREAADRLEGSGSPSSDGHQTDNGSSTSMPETTKPPVNTGDFGWWS